MEESSIKKSGVHDLRAVSRLADRMKHAPQPRNNSELPAGSPMYFYCRICGSLVATLPESYSVSSPKHCPECADLKAVSNMTDFSLKQMAEEWSKDCVVTKFSSRVCERGLRCCEVRHD